MRQAHLRPLHILGVGHEDVCHVILIASALGVAGAALQARLAGAVQNAQSAALPRLQRAIGGRQASASSLGRDDFLLRPLALSRDL